jgi:hypothetical protein
MTSKQFFGYKLKNQFLDDMVAITTEAYIVNMYIPDDVQKINSEMYDIACKEFREFLKKYPINKP